MQADNYYEALDSFLDAKKGAKAFYVRVELKTGEAVNSSTLPIGFWTRFIQSLEMAEAAQAALPLWDREHKQLTMVPHNNVRFVSVVFV